MVLRSFALALLLVGTAVAQPKATSKSADADADLAWLNRYLAANASGRSASSGHRGPSLAFADLRPRIGAPLRVTLKNGSSRFGVLTQANGREAQLRVRVGAGDYLFRFAADDVSRIEAR